MQYNIKRVFIGLMGAAALPLIVACSSHEKVTETTAYVPTTPAPQVVVQPSAPPAVTVVTPSTTATTTDQRSMNSIDAGTSGNAETTTSYKSESTTVTPSVPTETSSTYEKKVYKSNY